ncbi:hypothetical protein G7K_5306-t1 [Saitoella complicata NRRL Y-17804]|uniref:RNA helicase n=1 Tax=Saitoella complicata (strain BCRC 22490 / CBS 7301 / JCM 7358 / NBRC 10748 / NRRL Y-17804) TaxID=698492 RepID=A0A0E9NP40_SAICN|nr:hypothetical protein G7K_5306-t1 [Saitoella complicata NRRL Y-17804]
MSKRARPDDLDFIGTIDSDAELSVEEEEEEIASSDSEVEQSEVEEEQASVIKKGKKAAAQKPKKAKQLKAKVEKAKEQDIDPEFEFDNGQATGLGVDEGGMEGWGFSGAGLREGRRDVNIDDIVKKRRKLDLKEESEDGIEKDEEEEEEEFKGFGSESEDDGEGEGFGEGVPEGMQEEDEEEEELPNLDSEEEDEDEEQEDDENDEEDAGSDDESVASVVEHPHDLKGSDDEEEEETAEEKARQEAYFAPAEESAGSVTASFQDMNLSRPILKGLNAVGFTNPTAIQAKTIPVALLGKDIVGGAVTGSGKTAAFIVPILERLLYRPKKVPTSRVLVLTPTRELAMQCYNVGIKLAAFTDIRFCLCVGGLSLKAQEAELRTRPDVIIATPGRFIDHVRNSIAFTTDNIEIMVMDEADRMLEDGFADELNEIVEACPVGRQTMLFSATMTSDIDQLIRLSLNRPVKLQVDQKKATAAGLTQEFIRIRPQREHLRPAMLLALCTHYFKRRVLIFFRSKVYAHKMRIIFALSGLKAAELHGNLSQEQRIQALEGFKDGKADFLLATDLASRGIDIKGIDVVINYEAPQSHEIYLHRVGRTARAGRIGRSVTLAGEADRKVVKAAVKAAETQKMKVGSRTLDNDLVDKLGAKIAGMEDEIEEVMKDEREEKLLRQAEMEIRRGENVMKYEDEIKSRPARTWFTNEKGKKDAKEKSAAVLNPKAEKKLSNKQLKKKRTADGEDMPRAYKKTKVERTTKPARGKAAGTGKTKNAKGGARAPKPKDSYISTRR